MRLKSLAHKLKFLDKMADDILSGKENAIELDLDGQRFTISGDDAKYYCSGVKTVLTYLGDFDAIKIGS